MEQQRHSRWSRVFGAGAGFPRAAVLFFSPIVGARRLRAAAMALAAVAMAASVLVVPSAFSNGGTPAFALTGAPTYEISGEWLNPPATIGRGIPVVAEWHVNVNDSGNPPLNDPVDNVTATFTVDKAVFDELPDICLTTGVTPPSNISADGLAMTCNFGTLNAGTAVSVQTPVVVTGLTNEEVTASGTNLESETATLPPIPIRNTFGMDIYYGENVSYQNWNDTFTAVDLNIEWSLRLAKGSDPGPDTVTYQLTVGATGGAPVSVGSRPGTGEVGCSNFALGATAGHPYSGHPGLPPGHPQETNFVGTCTLTQINANTFQLTLSGIDYSLMNLPTMDSAGNTLDPAWNYIATGSLWFHVTTNQSGALVVDSNEPTYTSTTGLTSTDLAANNLTSHTYTLAGGFSSGFWRPYTNSGGNQWDDTYRVSPGTTLLQWVNHHFPPTGGPTSMLGECLAFDTAHVEYVAPPGDVGFGQIRAFRDPGAAGGEVLTNPPPIEYYVGPAPANPSTFDCGSDPAGWTTSPPADLSTVKAIRIQFPKSLASAEDMWGIQLNGYVRVKDDVAVGQDIWSFGSALDGNGVWAGWQPEWQAPGVQLTPTPGARYPFTTGRRDIVRIITAVPRILKAASEKSILPGEPVDFTLTYSATGAGAIPPTVDNYQIVDTLPVGMTYQPGSASIPPTSITTNASGQQVLTWVLNDVPTNEDHELTYQAAADDSAEPGEPLTNIAQSSLPGVTSAPASSTVTLSSNGYTTILKTPDDAQVQITNDAGEVLVPWTVTIRSFDPLPQAFTDTIDILPYNGDGRGTDFTGDYALQPVVAPAGSTVYYTTATPGSLNDDPRDASNGTYPASGNPIPNAAIWSTTAPADMGTVTAIRVIGPALESGNTFQFQVVLATSGAEPSDVYVNSSQGVAEHTALPMRTSAPIELYEDVLDKQFTSLNRNADGSYTAVFTISNTRFGNGPGYDLTDTLQYGDSVTLVAPPTAANTVPGDGSITVVNGWDAASGMLTIANDVPIADEVTHTYTVTSNVTIDGEIASFANTNCSLDGNETGTGLLNTATLTVEEVDKPDPDCVEPPFVEHDKEMTSGPTPIGDGLYEVEYTITVRNLGAGNDTYDLTDDFKFGEAITIEGTPTVENTTPGTIETLGTWDGEATTLAVVADEPIAGSTSDGPTIHEYVVTAQVSVDAPAVTLANTDCALGEESGSGLFNETTLTVDEHVTNDDDCGEISEPVHEKVVSSGPTPIGDGRYEVVYTVTVTNAGAADSAYDLDDRLRFGAGITVVNATAANTTPGTIAVNTGWNGTTDIRIASAVPIVAATEAGPATHVYAVTVIVELPDDIKPSVADCELSGGESGTGLLNDAVTTVNGEETSKEVCPPLPITTFDKNLVSVTSNRDGTKTVTYTLTVNRTGTGSPYNLNDRLRYGPAASVLSTSVVGTAPATLSVNAGWNGTGNTVVASNVAIADGETHVYTATVVVDIDTAASTASNRDCALGGGESGTGLYNEATLETNGVEYHDNACNPYDPPPGALPRTGANTVLQLGGALALMLSGLALVMEGQRRRRRTVMGAAS